VALPVPCGILGSRGSKTNMEVAAASSIAFGQKSFSCLISKGGGWIRGLEGLPKSPGNALHDAFEHVIVQQWHIHEHSSRLFFLRD
jgi:hypothetical protein